jgi:hypothetical protein
MKMTQDVLTYMLIAASVMYTLTGVYRMILPRNKTKPAHCAGCAGCQVKNKV